MRTFQKQEVRMIPGFSHGLNYLAVLVSGVGSMILGFLWYGPLFGKPWAGFTGWTTEKVKTVPGGQMALSYILAFVVAIVQAITLSILVRSLGVTAWSDGLWTGVCAGVGFTAMGFAATFLFEHKPFGLWLIVAGYEVVYLAGAGLLVTVWR
jgi:hypothetical protein